MIQPDNDAAVSYGNETLCIVACCLFQWRSKDLVRGSRQAVVVGKQNHEGSQDSQRRLKILRLGDRRSVNPIHQLQDILGCIRVSSQGYGIGLSNIIQSVTVDALADQT